MKRKMIIFTGFIASALLLGACSDKEPPNEIPKKEEQPQTQAEQPKEQQPPAKTDTDKLKEHIQEQEEKMEKLTEEVEYYKQYVKDLTLTLSPEKLQAIIDKEWKYSLEVNNVQFPKNGILEISQSDFELIIEEERVPYSVLPEEESIKGKIPSELEQSLQITAPLEKMSSKSDTPNGNEILTYSFKGLSPDDVIKVKLSENLSQKLGMSTVDLEIRVKE